MLFETWFIHYYFINFSLAMKKITFKRKFDLWCNFYENCHIQIRSSLLLNTMQTILRIDKLHKFPHLVTKLKTLHNIIVLLKTNETSEEMLSFCDYIVFRKSYSRFFYYYYWYLIVYKLVTKSKWYLCKSVKLGCHL